MRRVVKVGGSLLTRPDLEVALPRWLDAQRRAQTLLVFGGGELIDAIRHLDQIRPGSAAAVHWRCVDLLQVTFAMAAEWFRKWPVIDSAVELDRVIKSPNETVPTLVSVRAFYTPDAGGELPLTWDTTTDSIAALLAVQCRADELVLLKSCPVDPALDVRQLAEDGIVDKAFPAIAPQLATIRIEQLP